MITKFTQYIKEDFEDPKQASDIIELFRQLCDDFPVKIEIQFPNSSQKDIDDIDISSVRFKGWQEEYEYFRVFIIFPDKITYPIKLMSDVLNQFTKEIYPILNDMGWDSDKIKFDNDQYELKSIHIIFEKS